MIVKASRSNLMNKVRFRSSAATKRRKYLRIAAGTRILKSWAEPDASRGEVLQFGGGKAYSRQTCEARCVVALLTRKEECCDREEEAGRK